MLPTIFGVVGHFYGQTRTGTSTVTREITGWAPTGPSLIQDILDGAYTA
jgi:hypothetical protein